MPKTPEQICPVCDKPVGNDPHEECFAKLQAEQAPQEASSAMPCPACGEPMVNMACHNADCENTTADS